MFLLIIIIFTLIIPVVRRVLYVYIPMTPHFAYWKMIDIYRYFKNKEWKDFKGYGLHIYVGLFGAGKTISMVEKARRIAKAYPQVTILTNIKLFDFPEHSKIEPLINFKQIIDAPGDTLILIDEISSILNSRRWDKEGVPAALLGQLLQIRKQRKMLLATAQRFLHVDKLVRDITFTVRDCNTISGRWTFTKIYDAWDYERATDMKPVYPIGHSTFIQTDKLRASYDTYELIDSLKKEEFLTDGEVIARQGAANGDIVVAIDTKKPKRKLFK
jgi:hypothetical protein